MKLLCILMIPACLSAGCLARAVVEIPEARETDCHCAAPVAFVRANDSREAPDMLERDDLSGYNTRPFPRDLVSAALRARLEEEGCVVVEIPDPSSLEAAELRKFLSDHGLPRVVRMEVENLSLRGAAWPLGKDRVEAVLKMDIIPAALAGAHHETARYTASRRPWLRLYLRHDKVVSGATAEAICGAVDALVSRPDVRQTIGLGECRYPRK